MLEKHENNEDVLYKGQLRKLLKHYRDTFLQESHPEATAITALLTQLKKPRQWPRGFPYKPGDPIALFGKTFTDEYSKKQKTIRTSRPVALPNTPIEFVNLLDEFLTQGNTDEQARFTAEGRARAIMGPNFFGVQAAVQNFNIQPTGEQIAQLARVSFSEETLEACKDTHLLVAVLPISIWEMHMHAEAVGKKVFYAPKSWKNYDFSKEKGEAEWHLIRKTIVDNSTNKNWEEQIKLLSVDEQVPNARALIYTMIGHFWETGEWLFKGTGGRSSDSIGNVNGRETHERIGIVRPFEKPHSPDIDDFPDDLRVPYVGLASERKSLKSKVGFYTLDLDMADGDSALTGPSSGPTAQIQSM